MRELKKDFGQIIKSTNEICSPLKNVQKGTNMNCLGNGQFAHRLHFGIWVTMVVFSFGWGAKGVNIFVSNYGVSDIEEYNSSGQGTVFASGSSISGPEGMAFDSSGNLYEVDQGGDILKIDPQGNKSVFAVANFYSIGLAIDANNNVYVANSHTGTIEKYSPNGTGTLFASGLGFATGLAFDNSGNLYVADTSAKTIFEISPTGNKTAFASGGLLQYPFGLAFNAQGNLFVANGTSIAEFNSAGHGTTFATSDLAEPEGLAFDNAGNLYVANFGTTNYGDIAEFDPLGNGSVFTTSVSQPTFIAIQEVPEPSVLAFMALGLGLALVPLRGERKDRNGVSHFKKLSVGCRSTGGKSAATTFLLIDHL